MSGFIWLDVVDESGGSIVDATPSTKGVIKLTSDLSGDADNPTVSKINGANVPMAGSLTIGQILKVSGSSAITYGALDLSNINSVTGVLPNTNLSDATTISKGIIELSGDLGGTAGVPSVLKINGTSIASSPSTNQVLIALGTTSSSWSQITDANIASNAAIVASKLFYSDSISPTLSATTVQTAIDAIKTIAVATAIQRLSQNVTTANLQAAGAILTSSFNIGSVLPANARVLGVEINVTQILAGLGLSVALITVQGSGDTVGSLLASNTLLTTGLYGGTGTNQYLSRSGQQLVATVTLTGAFLSTITSGSFTVNVFYAVVL